MKPMKKIKLLFAQITKGRVKFFKREKTVLREFSKSTLMVDRVRSGCDTTRYLARLA